MIGTYEWDGSKEIIDSEDKELLKLLEAPYTTRGGRKTREAYVSMDVTHQPQTERHFNALVVEMDRFGFEAIELEE